jgi:threonine/homoserine/homoserine lactone efflux protein
MSLAVYLSFVGTSLLFCLIPGPSVCFTIAHAIRHGGRRTLPTILGQATANALQLLVIAVGLSSILERSVVFCTGFRLAGAAYLIYLGARTFTAPEPPFGDQTVSVRGRGNGFLDGLVVCGTNPKALVYYAAFLPQFMSPLAESTQQLLVLGSSSLLIVVLVLLLYTALAAQARHWLLERGLWRAQTRASGTLIIAAGATLALADTR